jgi:hypothetical protein
VDERTSLASRIVEIARQWLYLIVFVTAASIATHIYNHLSGDHLWTFIEGPSDFLLGIVMLLVGLLIYRFLKGVGRNDD